MAIRDNVPGFRCGDIVVAIDDQPVDLVFLLLAPEGAGADHLKALSRIARVLRDADNTAKIRGTKDAAAIHSFLAQAPASNAA